MIKNNLSKHLSFSILLVAIGTIQPWTTFPIGNTTIWWIIQAYILFIFWKSKYLFSDHTENQSLKVIQWYLIYNIFSFFRGTLISESYWDFKNLISNSMAILIPVIAYAATNKDILQNILSFYFKYTLPLFLIFAFTITSDIFGFYLVPVSFILLFFSALKIQWKLILLLISIFVITADYGARSNVIKFSSSILLSLIYYIRTLVPKKLIELIRVLMFILPLVLFSLAATDIFNIFDTKDFVKKDYVDVKTNAEGEIVEEDLTADTRTFLYQEVLVSAKKNNSWWIGRSPARGNESESFGESDMSGRNERIGNEVAILNIFTWTGITGVILYLAILFNASYLAINYSNNFYSKILGLFIAFRWIYAWIEDVNYFNLNMVTLWLFIGLCFSKSFRKMNDEDVNQWVRGIFK